VNYLRQSPAGVRFMGRVTNTESFIREANIVHENKYDYSLIKYIRSCDKVEIVCGEHGVFWQRAEIHIYGQGCPKCRNGKTRVKRGLIINREIPSNVPGKRKCSKCGLFYDLSHFYPNQKVSDGLDSFCKWCSKRATKEWKKRNYEKRRVYNKEYAKKRWAEHKKEHKMEYEQRAMERERQHQECLLLDKLKRRLKSRLKDALGRNSEIPHIKDLLGCSLKEFKEYIESKWSGGMNWGNNTYFGWHLDHIKPCASFLNLLIDTEEQKECFHYTNYQPLWRRFNQTKSAKYNGKDYRKRRI